MGLKAEDVLGYVSKRRVLKGSKESRSAVSKTIRQFHAAAVI